MSATNNHDVVVVDASIIVSISSKEAATHLTAETALNDYTKKGFEFFAPNVIVAEVIFALCQKLVAGVLTKAEHMKAVKSFLDLMKSLSMPTNETDLVMRATEIRETYGCSRSSDSLYIALAKDLAKTEPLSF